GLLGAPIVPRAPVLGELLEVAKWYAAGPTHAGQLARPAGVGEPMMQVVEVGLWDLDAERLNGVTQSCFSFMLGECRVNSGTFCSYIRLGSKHVGNLGTPAAFAFPAAAAARLDKRGPGQPAQCHHPHHPQRRRPASPPRLSRRGAAWCGRRGPTPPPGDPSPAPARGPGGGGRR